MFRKSLFDVIKNEIYYLTDTPHNSRTLEQMSEYEQASKDFMKDIVLKWKKINHGEEFERCVAYFILNNKNTNTKFVSINAHIGISHEGRFFASQKINDLITYIKTNESIDKIIMSGDFNSFPDDKGKEQIQQIQLKDLNLNKYLPDYRTNSNFSSAMPFSNAPNTFHAYVYDFGCCTSIKIKTAIDELFNMKNTNQNPDPDKICNKTLEIFSLCHDEKLFGGTYPLGGQLDHILYNNIDADGIIVPLWKENVEACEFTSDAIFKSVIQEYIKTKGPLLMSDHQGILTSFIL